MINGSITKKILICLTILCTFLTSVVCYIFKLQYDFPRQTFYSINDFEMKGLTITDGVVDVIEANPQLIMYFDMPRYVEEIDIYSRLWKRTNFQIWVDTLYSDECVSRVNTINSVGDNKSNHINVLVNEEITALRINIDACVGSSINMDNVRIYENSYIYKRIYIFYIVLWFAIFAALYRLTKCFLNNKSLKRCDEFYNNLRQRIYLFELFLIVAMTSLMITHITTWLNNSEPYAARGRYYQVKDCDVLFMGTSHMHDAVYPMEMWRDYGISSYNLAYPGERLPMTYYSLRDSISTQKPKLVVVDVYGLIYGNEKNDPNYYQRSHYTFDAMKMGKNKVEGVVDCLNRKLWSEFIFPFELYHTRWNSIDREMLDITANERFWTKGACFDIGVADAHEPELIGRDEYDNTNTYAFMYLERMVKLCSENDLPILLICIPYPASVEEQKIVNEAQVIADYYENVTYVNMLYLTEEIGLDYSTDMADEKWHLNPLGARKVTDYLGKYIKANYSLNDYRDDVRWRQSYSEYLYKCKNRKFNTIENMKEYLMLLQDKDYTYVVENGMDSIHREDVTTIKIRTTKDNSIVDISTWNDAGVRVFN